MSSRREDKYKANYDALLALPFVKRLIKKNKRLIKRNKWLENLIYSLPEFRRTCCCNDGCKQTTENVRIKVEKDNAKPKP